MAEVRVLPEGPCQSGVLLNLSKTGCCFLANEGLSFGEGSAVEVHLKVCGIDLRMAGVIRHVYKGRRAGIEFVQLSERKRSQIDELLVELFSLCKAASVARAAVRSLYDRD
jgi:c-di-GMP-binding flagellar brake protein YcgR